jgi:predicted transcriptional regulator
MRIAEVPVTVFLLAVLVSLFAVSAGPLGSGSQTEPGDVEAYWHNGDVTAIVHLASPTGSRLIGQLTLQVIDFDDNPIAEATTTAVLRSHTRRFRLVLPIDEASGDPYWYRLRYEFRSASSVITKTVSLSQFLPQLETHVLGQTDFVAGSPASIRIVTLDHGTQQALSDAAVTIDLVISGDEDPRRLFSGRTNSGGTVDASFFIPDVASDEAKLVIIAESEIGRDVVERHVTIGRSNQILLVTDKPLYQPGQLIHLRALVLRRPDRAAAAGLPLTLEIEDPRGNKVFKVTQTTSKFGIASADFQLADEINMGPYHVRALIGDDVSEKTVTVERYVLPKFEVEVTTDRTYYLPGQKLQGDIQVDYFFGKPVSGGRVEVGLAKFDIGFDEFARITGTTDDEGHFRFDTVLPDYFVGQPLEEGKALIKLEVRITDQANHEESKTITRTVAAHPISVVIIPESGDLVPGVENIVYVLTAYPDGTPAEARVTLRIEGTGAEFSAAADDLGIATFTAPLRPSGGAAGSVDNVKLVATATDRSGNTGQVTLESEFDEAPDHVLVRADQSLYRVGDPIEVTLLTTTGSGRAYLDLVKEGQTVLTRSLAISGGRGRVSLDLDETMSGTLWLHAYIISRTGHMVRDTRVVYVNPANDLSIAITPDRDTYRPGEDAQILFQVTDGNGQPVLSALGISIVDESVFALQELQPGLEKVYFTLEEEIMKPRYEIHAFTPRDLVRWPVDQPPPGHKDKAAAVLFATAAEPPTTYSLAVNTFTERQERLRELAEERLRRDAARLSESLQEFVRRRQRAITRKEGLEAAVRAGHLRQDEILDPWGNPYRLLRDYSGWNLELMSAGPDGVEETADDLTWSEQMLLFEGERMDMANLRAGVGGFGMPFDKKEADLLASVSEEIPAPAGAPDATGVAEPRIRRYFPETLWWQPQLITDRHGRATLDIKMADSITRWRLTSMASSASGMLGSQTTGIIAFQDFFVDLDLPVSLTEKDIVSIPVAIYNYLETTQDVGLELQPDDWYELDGDRTIRLTLDPNEVTVAYYRIKAMEIGLHEITVKAYGSEMSDAIARKVEVVPDGQEQWISASERLDARAVQTLHIPQAAIDGASRILARIYPGIFSQIVEGLDSMLQVPFGCFEQTSSVTYPNILVLHYMRETDQITPEIEMKAEQYINLGYQRLLSFEVPGGGFEWFGNAPASKILSAYGLMEFQDMSEVYEIDQEIITRTRRWLIAQQNGDGSWSPDASYLHAESWGRIQNSNLLPTAYILWALLETDYQGEETSRALSYLRAHLDEAEGPYTLAIAANALVAADRNHASTRKAFDDLLALAIVEGDAMHWESEIPSFTHARDKSADIETTALAAYALIRYGKRADATSQVLNYLIESKDPYGRWYTTQGTILALRALLASLGTTAESTDATVTITINGEKAETIEITPETSDVMRLVDLGRFTQEGANTIELTFDGEGSALYELAAKYFVPWRLVPLPREGLLAIDVEYDKRELEMNDTVVSHVRVETRRPGRAEMVIVDLGIPPGFSVETADLTELVDNATIQKYSLTGRQIIIYLDKIESGKPVEFDYRLRATMPVVASSGVSRVYEYYNTDVEAISQPVEMVVGEHQAEDNNEG